MTEACNRDAPRAATQRPAIRSRWQRSGSRVSGAAALISWVSIALGSTFLDAPAARAQGEAHYEDNPAAESVEDLENPLEEDFKRERLDALSEKLREALTRSPLVPDGSHLGIDFRSYYLYGKLKDNTRREAWVYGGSILYATGWVRGWMGKRFSLGGQLQLPQPIHAPSDRDGTLLLRSRQRQYAVLGQSYVKLELAEGHGICRT
jgi:hypothetical protein